MSKNTAEIRQAFLDFFHSKGHQVVKSSSLVPANDPTLLFTNAGMNQFKEVFLGIDKRHYSRAVTSQRCVRAGGKHNDLENVGHTARHHTFFEMLGNFSFGDYFKREAICYAWELLTSPLWFNLPEEKLWVTVYETDDEAYQIWAEEIGVPEERIIRIGDNKGGAYASDNFWQMGDTGPCGPCTEIFYDHGASLFGGGPGSPEEDGDRYIEIWNIVFMQFNRELDGSMLLLPKPSVDTGMGLERIAAVLQHVNSNYEIDLFQRLIASIAKVAAVSDLTHHSLRVIADHIRACAFLVADGILPSNEGRGYVLRRIIRRAVRHGHMLGIQDTFFYKLVVVLIEVMGSVANQLKDQQQRVEQVLKNEEEQFLSTLSRGLALLDEELAQLEGDTLDGETAFRLYDTYGFPLDLTADVCRERQLKVDEAGFDQAMEEQRRRARGANTFAADYNSMLRTDDVSVFSGYDHVAQEALVTALFRDGQWVERLEKGEQGIVVLDNTVFYPEAGGQIGDRGELIAQDVSFNVEDSQKYGHAIGHLGTMVQGSLQIGSEINAKIDKVRRHCIRLNHSATHLLHEALRRVLGEHVAQKGSLVTDSYLRFDFSHYTAMTVQQVRQVDEIVNAQIRHNLTVETQVMALEAAKAKGAMALFGEKYDEVVRVLSMGDFSVELCGGTHVEQTGDIGLFRLVAESGTAAGVRRIEAVTGERALALTYQDNDRLHDMACWLKTDVHSLGDKLRTLLDKTRQMERELQQLKDQQAAQESATMSSQTVEIKGVKVLVHQLENVEAKMLRTMVDDLKNQMRSVIIVLAAVIEGKVNLIAGVTPDLINKIKAGELVDMVAQQVGGKGGGRADMAQAGGKEVSGLPQALASVIPWVENRL